MKENGLKEKNTDKEATHLPMAIFIEDVNIFYFILEWKEGEKWLIFL
jgi:hypothetical protein